MQFTMAMLNHYDVERPPLPVINLSSEMSLLTALANEGHYDQVFARQIQALGQEGDVLLVLSTSGNADNILHAVNAANDKWNGYYCFNWQRWRSACQSFRA